MTTLHRWMSCQRFSERRTHLARQSNEWNTANDRTQKGDKRERNLGPRRESEEIFTYSGCKESEKRPGLNEHLQTRAIRPTRPSKNPVTITTSISARLYASSKREQNWTQAFEQERSAGGQKITNGRVEKSRRSGVPRDGQGGHVKLSVAGYRRDHYWKRIWSKIKAEVGTNDWCWWLEEADEHLQQSSRAIRIKSKDHLE